MPFGWDPTSRCDLSYHVVDNTSVHLLRGGPVWHSTNWMPASYNHAHGVVPMPSGVHCITLNQGLVHNQPQQDNLTAIFSFQFDNMKMPSDSFIIKS